MNGWASVVTAGLIALGLLTLARHERRAVAAAGESETPQNAPPLWLRASLTLAVLYAPLSWLVWFDDDLGYKRSLLALWLAFPGLLPVRLVAAAFGSAARPEWLVSTIAALVAAGIVVGVVALMRSSWKWCAILGVATLVASSAISFVVYVLARL